jgi:hypothetical protein
MARSYYGRFHTTGSTITDFAKSEQDSVLKSIEYFREANKENGFKMEDTIVATHLDQKINMVNALIDLANKDNKITKQMPGFRSEQLAWATSLQAMGGGDVLSAMAQNPQDRTAENTAQAVQVLQQIDLKTGLLIPKAAPSLEPGATAPSTP